MSIGRTRFRGKVRIHGRPREQAKAEIMVMKHKEAFENRRRRQMFFTILDIIAILSFLAGLYSIYKGRLTNGFLLIGVGVVILAYFILRRVLKKNRKFNKQ